MSNSCYGISTLILVLTQIIQGLITDVTPVIINPVVPGRVCHGCTVAKTVITIDPSTVLQWYPPVGNVHELGPTTQSTAMLPTWHTVVLPTWHAATPTTLGTVASTPPHSVGLLPMTQGLGGSPNNLIHLDYDFTVGSRHFDPSNPNDTSWSAPASNLSCAVTMSCRSSSRDHCNGWLAGFWNCASAAAALSKK